MGGGLSGDKSQHHSIPYFRLCIAFISFRMIWNFLEQKKSRNNKKAQKHFDN